MNIYSERKCARNGERMYITDLELREGRFWNVSLLLTNSYGFPFVDPVQNVVEMKKPQREFFSNVLAVWAYREVGSIGKIIYIVRNGVVIAKLVTNASSGVANVHIVEDMTLSRTDKRVLNAIIEELRK